jgi:hypothetical protein
LTLVFAAAAPDVVPLYPARMPAETEPLRLGVGPALTVPLAVTVMVLVAVDKIVVSRLTATIPEPPELMMLPASVVTDTLPLP